VLVQGIANDEGNHQYLENVNGQPRRCGRSGRYSLYPLVSFIIMLLITFTVMTPLLV
jgi:hypothetical protein